LKKRRGRSIVSIKFICSCGKHLRARDEMAARRSMCPRCGAPVGVPSLRPTHAGTLAAPLTPQERRRLRLGRPDDDTLAAEPAATLTADLPPLDPPAIPALKNTRRLRQLETCWVECLAYPFINRRLLLTLAFVLTVLSGGFVLLIPDLPRFPELVSTYGWPYGAFFLLAPLLFFVYTCATIECALKSALAGKGPGLCWPGHHLFAILKSGLRWLICFLAGPLVLLALAGYFWLYGGDHTGLDWAILVELIVLAVAYWFLTVVCSAENDRLRDANPVRVARLLFRLRSLAAVPIVVAPILMSAHVAVAVFALAALHQHGSAWLLLMGCWASGLFCITFLFRLLGVWCYRNAAHVDPQGP
jgi:hypothetical protein